jgi:class 3 adenylate cyclase/TolB-like protein/tetratricopeptide (TPR) repeat protein
MPVTRKLAAVVIADVVGYSRLMERDEAGTHARLRELREKLFDPKIAEHRGRIVRTSGDGMLVEFPSATAALRCAVEVQREMGARNLYVTPDERIELRVGINLGDIIVDGEDIAGDGVNVAARLETLAEPGGICVGSAVWEQVHEDLGVEFVDAGEQHVKNISKPIRVYRVELGKGVASKARVRTPTAAAQVGRRLAEHRTALAVSAVIVLAGIGWGVWQWTQRPALPAAIEGQQGPPLMSVAVLPFTPASASTDDAQLAETFTQDVTSSLERSVRFALVASHGAAAKYKERPTDPRTVGRDLNVRYLVEGDLRQEAGSLTIAAQLVETANATQVWSVRLVAPKSARGDDNQGLAARLTNALRVALLDTEMKRVAEMPTAGAGAMELVLHAYAIDAQSTSDTTDARARQLYEDALRRDPHSVPALLGLYWADMSDTWESVGADQERLVREMDDLSSRALVLDRDDPRVWEARSDVLSWQGQWGRALETAAEALRIDPYRDRALVQRARVLIFTGQTAAALSVLDQVIALEPRDPAVAYWLQLRCMAHLNRGEYDAAISDCEKSVALEDYWFRHLLLTAAYAQKGDMPKAMAAKAALLKQKPDISIARLRTLGLYTNPTFQQQSEATRDAGLRKAGIPDR